MEKEVKVSMTHDISSVIKIISNLFRLIESFKLKHITDITAVVSHDTQLKTFLYSFIDQL